MNFLLSVVQWWIVFFILGGIAFAATSRFFSSFFDKGYIFSKIVGLMVISYLMLSLGVLRLLPFSAWSLYALLVLLLIPSAFFARRYHVLSTVTNSWKIMLLEEILFSGMFLFWAYIKGFQPDIHGLEKFMDYGFLNSILRSTYFPPKDMWMAPLPINYYYFGHLMTAVATKLSFLPSNISFNLMLAFLFAFTFTGSFSLGGNFIYFLQKQRKSFIAFLTAGILTAFLLTCSGNLHTLYTFFTPYQNDNPVPPTNLVFSPDTFPNRYWYPNATRFIYHTIHEFPIYSFVVSDLHGHVLDIPGVLLMIALLTTFFIQDNKEKKVFFTHSALIGFLAGILYMTNAWDGLIYGGALLILVLYKLAQQRLLHAASVIRGMLIVGASFIAGSLPFSLFFKPFASEVGLNCAPNFLLHLGHIGPIIFEQGYCQFSPLWQLAILYGFFFFWFIALGIFLLKYRKHQAPFDVFIVGLGLLGFLLILIPEFFYLKDIYTTYFRANTMFKMVYQSFILLSLVSGYSIYRISFTIKKVQKNLAQRLLFFIFTILSTILIALVMIYPYFAITSYFNNLQHFQGLNGIRYLQAISNDDYLAVLWLNKTIQGQPILLEAQGDSYTDYERISANTGLPTVFGWMVHEWLWRGTYDIVPGRIADVKALYESHNIEETRILLKKYNVAYVYIGDMERSKYPALDEAKFSLLGSVIYHSGSVTIYKIH